MMDKHNKNIKYITIKEIFKEINWLNGIMAQRHNGTTAQRHKGKGTSISL
jgi:hypothetical protein